MRKVLFVLTLFLLLVVSTSYAQNIKDGSRWWDGERLYTAYVDAMSGWKAKAWKWVAISSC